RTPRGVRGPIVAPDQHAMTGYLVRRILQAVVLLWIVSVVTFVLIHSAPGGPAMLQNPDLSRDQVAQFRANLGLDDPLPVQYARWFGGVLHGDFGRSYNTVESVPRLLSTRLPNTLLLTGIGLGLSLVIAIPLGVVCATHRNTPFDRIIAGISFLGISTPVFFLGIVLIVVFSVELKALPAGGMYQIGAAVSVGDRIQHLLMPVFVLTVANLTEITRYTRSAMIGALGEDYVRTAHAKGLSGRVVLYRHALRNALIPVITIIGVYLPRTVSATAITETVFSWPGLGQLAVQSAATRDYPVVLGATLAVAVVAVGSSLLTDLAYGYVDPRIRLG
ncbi:MAG TPA: ABC transporter permease, partial [bacterium]|nr:ABC transporter permease [bacterium]